MARPHGLALEKTVRQSNLALSTEHSHPHGLGIHLLQTRGKRKRTETKDAKRILARGGSTGGPWGKELDRALKRGGDRFLSGGGEIWVIYTSC